MSGLAWFFSSPVLHLFTLDATKASRQVFVGFKFERGGAVFVNNCPECINAKASGPDLWHLDSNPITCSSFISTANERFGTAIFPEGL